MVGTRQKKQDTVIYSAGIISQSFWFVEFKKYLKLISEGLSQKEIKALATEKNLFGAPNEYRANRIFGYLSNRANCINSKGIDLFFSSDLSTQKLLNLICVIRQDRLFFEFVNEVYREKIIFGIQTLEPSDVNIFFRSKEIQSETVAGWTDKTKKQMGNSYSHFLTDANLLTITDKKKEITPPLLDIALERYLDTSGDTSIIKAITGGL